MIVRIHTRYLALVLFFAFCQVMGMMCALPDLSVAEDTVILVKESATCPMHGTTMCLPSLTASPERQIKNSMVMHVDHAPILLTPAALLTVPSVSTWWSWSSVLPIVTISIGSSSVLRI